MKIIMCDKRKSDNEIYFVQTYQMQWKFVPNTLKTRRTVVGRDRRVQLFLDSDPVSYTFSDPHPDPVD
jgi:hypothetical protein